MLTFQTERWPSVVEEIKPLLYLNWCETALDHAEIPLDPDFERYAKADIDGSLHITTARIGASLVGYFVLFVVRHPHYKSTLFALMDAYFLEQEHRRGPNGIRLFLEAESALRARGVREIIANSKVSHDMSAIFERLNWRRTAIAYTKLLEPE